MTLARAIILGLVAAVACGAAGCADNWWDVRTWEIAPQEHSPEPTPAPALSDEWAAPGEGMADAAAEGDAQTAASAGDDGLFVLGVHFDLMRVDVPVTETRNAGKVWNHLNESLGDPGLTALLARNGFRIGKGDQADWPALRAIFERNGAKVNRVARTAQDGTPLTLPLGAIADGTGYFLHRRGGGMGGGTFNAGQRTFRIEYTLDTDDPRRVRLRIVPAFTEQQGEAKPVERDGEIVMVRDPTGRVFHELAVDVDLGPGEYVVIGPSAAAAAGFVLGSCWLDATMNLQQFETVLCISAQPTRIK